MDKETALELVQIAQGLVSLVAAHALGESGAAPDVAASLDRSIARLGAIKAKVQAGELV